MLLTHFINNFLRIVKIYPDINFLKLYVYNLLVLQIIVFITHLKQIKYSIVNTTNQIQKIYL